MLIDTSTYSSKYVNVAAPGINIATTQRNTLLKKNNYVSVKGTSYAAPIVSGILALMIELVNQYSITEDKIDYINKKLFDSAINTAETGPELDKHWRYGRVDAAAAIQAIKDHPPQ